MRRVVIAVAVIGLSGVLAVADPGAAGVFEGSTPCDKPIRTALQIPDTNAELIEWELALQPAASGGESGTYRLRYAYGATRAGRPGLAPDAPRLEQRGSWSLSNPGHTYKLSGGLAFRKVSDDILHVLNADGSFMVGNGGWSYTLVRRAASEPLVAPELVAADPGDEPRSISPLSRGPEVFGVFEGRTPCQRIARDLGAAARPGCWKVKWRVTLLQDPRSNEPTTYKVEGTLYGSHAREGKWRMTRGTPDDPQASVYELLPSSQHRGILLLKGDENVLFFVDQGRRLLVGTAQNTYTLDRRMS